MGTWSFSSINIGGKITSIKLTYLRLHEINTYFFVRNDVLEP